MKIVFFFNNNSRGHQNLYSFPRISNNKNISSHSSKAQKSKIKVHWCHQSQILLKALGENTSCSLQLLVAPGVTWFVKLFELQVQVFCLNSSNLYQEWFLVPMKIQCVFNDK